MRKTNRKSYSDAQNVALTSQVGGVCPLCDSPLFNRKGNRSYKAYEIAHIYPLNPSDEEIELLKDEERLGDDVNGEDNVIPLCLGCHGKFDKPRTVEEYRYLVAVKKRYIDRSGQQALWRDHHIEAELLSVIEALYKDEIDTIGIELNFNPHTIDEKVDETISKPTIRKIRNNVADYYTFIKARISELDKGTPNFSEIVSLQVKAYYKKQLQLGIDKQAVFDNLVAWVNAKTKPESIDAAEIIVSFFIQNCEVFE